MVLIPTVGQWALRVSIALVWLYQGFWNKFLVVRVLRWDDRHLRIMQQAMGERPGDWALHGLAVVETFFAIAVLLAWRPAWMAWMQIGLLTGMNTAGIVFAGSDIPDIGGMLTMNLVFCVAVWMNGKMSASARK